MSDRLANHTESDMAEAIRATFRQSGMTLDDWVAATLADKAGSTLLRRAVSSIAPAEAPATEERSAPEPDLRQAVPAMEAPAAAPEPHGERGRLLLSLANALGDIREHLGSPGQPASHEPVRSTPAATPQAVADASGDTLAAFDSAFAALSAEIARTPKPAAVAAQPAVDHTAASKPIAAARPQPTRDFGTPKPAVAAQPQPQPQPQPTDEHLNGLVARLATRTEIARIEDLVRSLRSTVDAARQDGSEAATAVAELGRQVEQFAARIPEQMHTDLRSAFDVLNWKLEGLPANGVDPAALRTIEAGLADLRRSVAALDRSEEGERIAAHLAALGERVADLRHATVADLRSDLAAAAGRLEDFAGERFGRLDDSIRAALDGLDRSSLEALLAALGHEVREIGTAQSRLATKDDIEAVGAVQARLATREQIEAMTAGAQEALRHRIDATALEARDVLREGIEAAARSLRDHMRERIEASALETEAALGERIEATASATRASIEGSLDGVAMAIRERLDGFETRLGEAQSSVWARTLEDLYRTLEAPRASEAEILQHVKAIGHRLDTDPVAERLDRLDDSLREVADPLAERLDRLDQGLREVARTAGAESWSDQFDRLRQEFRQVGTGADPLATRLDRIEEGLRQTAHAGAPAPLAERLDRLNDNLLQVMVATNLEPVAERLDRLDDGLRHVMRTTDTASLEIMLRSIGTRIDEVRAPREQLDGLERRIEAVAVALDRNLAPNAAVETLQQSLAETVAQMRGLREDVSIAALQATRTALAETRDGRSSGPEAAMLLQGLEDIKALHARLDERTGRALETIQETLATLIHRSPAAERTGAPAYASAAADVPRADPTWTRYPEAVPAARDWDDAPAAGRRPSDGEAISVRADAAYSGLALPSSEEPPQGGIRTNLIAAVRRAQQSFSDHPPQRPTSAAESHAGNPPAGDEDAYAGGRLRRAVQSHPRALLVGAAASVLAVGATQFPGSLPIKGFGTAQDAPKHTAPAPVSATKRPAPQAGSQTPAAAPASQAAAPAARAAQEAAAKPALASTATPAQETAAKPAPTPAQPVQDPAELYRQAMRLLENRDAAQDPAAITALLEKAASAGHVLAQFQLGYQHERGLRGKPDMKQAVEWYRRAAEGGHGQAMHNLAVLLSADTGSGPNYAAALPWYRQAAELGIRDSQFNLGIILAWGVGTARNLPEAYKWFALAAHQGDREAVTRRDELAATLPSADLTAAKAWVEAWRTKAADQGTKAAPSQGAAATTPAQGRQARV